MEKNKCITCGKIASLKGKQCYRCDITFCILISLLPEFIVLDEIVKAGGFIPFKQMKSVLERVKQLTPDVSKDYNIGSLIALADQRMWYSKIKEGLIPTEDGLKIHKDFCGAAYFFYDMELNPIKRVHLKKVDFARSDYTDCYLNDVVFTGYDLSGMSFYNSELVFVSFQDCNLKGCNFDMAEHLCCEFVNCNLHEADLSRIKKQFFDLLSHFPGACTTLRNLMREGKVEGVNNQDKLPYSLLNAVSLQYNKCVWHLVEKYKLVHRFGNLSMRQTPENNLIARIFDDWISEFERNSHGVC